MTQLTHLGYGVGFRPTHYRYITETKPQIDWFEIISENFMGVGGRPKKFLELLRRDYPVVMHGVGLSIASTDPLDLAYLNKLKELKEWLNPTMVSDHLCWTKHKGFHSYDLLPFPFTTESLALVSERIEQVQEYLQTPLLIENPSAYILPAFNELNEAEFLNELCKHTGCRILLDVNNLFVNSKNLNCDALQYLEILCADHVRQFHVAGHSIYSDIRIDTHDHPVCEEVWKLYQLAVTKWPNVPTLLEWDDHIPEFSELEHQLKLAKVYAHEALTTQKQQDLFSEMSNKNIASPEITLPKVRLPLPSHAIFLENFWQQLQSPSGIDENTMTAMQLASDTATPASTGLRVYNRAYFLRMRDILKDIFATISHILESEQFDRLCYHYLQKCPQTHFSIDGIGDQLINFLSSAKLNFNNSFDNQILGELAQFDLAYHQLSVANDESHIITRSDIESISPETWPTIKVKFCQYITVFKTTYNVTDVWLASKENQPVINIKYQPQNLLVYRNHENDICHQLCSDESYLAFKLFQDDHTFEEVVSHLNPKALYLSETIQSLCAHIIRWVDLGIVKSL